MTTLLAASTGGHLAQLHALRPRIVRDSDVVWMTFRGPQSESLLEGEEVVWLDYIPPRGYMQVVKNLPRALRAIRSRRVDHAFSTGSGIALPVFAAATLSGVRCTYIESAARSDGPSATGRLVSRMPGVACCTQYPSWADRTWHFGGAIFDQYASETVASPVVRRLLVTLGTIRPYTFDRLLRRLVEVVPDGVEVLVQHGVTKVDPSLERPDFTYVPDLPWADLQSETRAADAFVGHSGIGSVLTAFDAGRRPVLVVRRAAHEEHVDDHQAFIADEMGRRGLAVSVEASDLRWEDIVESTRQRVVERSAVEPFVLPGEASRP